MAGKTDKAKLASAIFNVGTTRITGVEKGATVNGGSEKPKNTAQEPQDGTVADEGQSGGVDGPAAAGVMGGSPEASGTQDADAMTARVSFMCRPKEKKHLKQLALDRDTNASALIREALEAKGYLP